MAAGKHWEWRAFGVMEDLSRANGADLDTYLLPHLVDDLYVWARGLAANIKVRSGAMAGLKFKRFLGAESPLELWLEDPAEYVPFPVEAKPWESLANDLQSVGLSLPPYPAHPPDRDDVIAALEQSGCELLQVTKQREMWSWQGPNGRVLVEQTRILHPQRITTIALESGEVNGEISTDQGRADLLAALTALNLERPELAPMNYMEAVATWVAAGSI